MCASVSPSPPPPFDKIAERQDGSARRNGEQRVDIALLCNTNQRGTCFTLRDVKEMQLSAVIGGIARDGTGKRARRNGDEITMHGAIQSFCIRVPGGQLFVRVPHPHVPKPFPV
jgi:hypothetical protein